MPVSFLALKMKNLTMEDVDKMKYGIVAETSIPLLKDTKRESLQDGVVS